MPAFAKLRIAALDDLARQLRFAPPEALRRQLERAEQLASEIDPAINYPEDWIVFRITGYRGDMPAPAMIVGEALLGDIGILVERLSAAARIGAGELEPGAYLSLEEVCERWRISRKTLERWRRQGLVARRVHLGRGRVRLMFPVAAIERFERSRAGQLAGAAVFERIAPGLRARVIRRAGAYARLGCTLNQAAARIAGRYGRGHETIRQLLMRHERGEGGRLFNQAGPPSARERELAARAFWFSVEPGRVAKRLGRSVASVHRAMNDERAERLRMMLGSGALPRPGEAAEGPDARPRAQGQGGVRARGVLRQETVSSGLGEPGQTDAAAFIATARAGGVVLGAVERSRAEAYRVLIARAGAMIAALPPHGAPALELDRVETDLRWAARLKAELVRSQLPLLIRTLEAALGRRLEEVRSALLVDLAGEGVRSIADAVHEFDPRRGGRLAAPVGLALNRVAARFLREHAAELGGERRTRATPVLGPGVPIPDWTLHIAPWQSFGARRWLEPDPRVRASIGRLGERDRVLLVSRFGWGPAPMTVAEVAPVIGLPLVRAVVAERAAIRRALRRGEK